MRSTFKLLFYINRNKVKSDGTTAVLCRISIDGKKSAVTTGVYCKPGDWDSKKCEIKTDLLVKTGAETPQKQENATL